MPSWPLSPRAPHGPGAGPRRGKLGSYIASCIGLLAAHGISSRDDTLEALDDMLDSFFTG
ncbi:MULTISPECIES: hypothetical protein [Streptomyces]|nr:hypothetical protein [Streptomyces canarius]